MNKLIQRFLAAVSLTVAIGMPANLFSQLEDTAVFTIAASVVHVDQETRELFVKELEGIFEEEPMETSEWYYRTFYVKKNVSAFDYVRSGDRVNLDVEVTLALDLREPTEEEMENPFHTETITTKKAVIEHDIIAVCEVIAIDRKYSKITLQGPKGGKFVMSVGARSMEKIYDVGTMVVATYKQGNVVGLSRAD